MKLICIFLLLTSIEWSFSSQAHPGHLKAFGSAGTRLPIAELSETYPDVLKLYTHHISKSEPVLSRQVLSKDFHYNVWQSDEDLKEIEGIDGVDVLVQSYKEIDRIPMSLKEFLTRYKRENLFLADNLPSILRKYLTVPTPLQCETTLPTFQSVVLIISGMNVSPLMFNENFDHFLCLFRGNKQMVLVNAHQYPDVHEIITSKTRNPREPPLNPDRVDLKQYPALANIEYHLANLTAGDCLFIPSGWIFQERSLDNTVTILFNINHQRALHLDQSEIENCASTTNDDPSFTVDQIDWSMVDHQPQSLKDIMLKLVNSTKNTFDDWQETFSKHVSFDIGKSPEVSSIFEEFYGIVDVDGDGQITMSEVETIHGAHQHHISDILYELMKSIDENQEKVKSTKRDDNEPIIDDAININDDDDEHLRLQNYKTDL